MSGWQRFPAFWSKLIGTCGISLKGALVANASAVEAKRFANFAAMAHPKQN
jgi:hypothetical protein